MKLGLRFFSFLLLIGYAALSEASNSELFFTRAPYTPRISAWAYGGSNSLAQGEFMLPMAGNSNALLFADAEVKYAGDANWFGGVGGGFRQNYDDSRILGAYTFIDRSLYTNSNASSESFWTLNLGLESLGEVWDFRANAYLPLSSANITVSSVFVDQLSNSSETAGHTVGHQQFNQRLNTFNHTGAGIDGEIGHFIPGLRQGRAYLGGYHFSLENSTDLNGVATRLEYAFSHSLAVVANYTYDNKKHSGVEVGFRFTLGGIAEDQTGNEIQRRLMDPLSRNLATRAQGTGVPITTSQALANNGQLFLERDNVYFFTTNGLVYDTAQTTTNCTFDHPCDDSSFTQLTIDSISGFASNVNFYFEPGTYNSFGSNINLHLGQSLFGRVAGYQAAAAGNARALFLGEISLLEGNNRLDSIRLLNSVSDNTGVGSQVTALTIQNASNIYLYNVDLQALATEAGNLTATNNNFATGIYSNNSTVSVENSSVTARAQVTGSNNGNNFSVAVGANTDGGLLPFSSNNFTFTNSTLSSTASVAAVNNALNFSSSLGANTNTGTANFNNNSFTLTDTTLTSLSSVDGNASSSIFSAGIGGNSFSGSSNFSNNSFILTRVTINSTALLNQNSTLETLTAGIGGNSGNLAVTDFTNNSITILNSTLNSSSTVGGDNTNINFVSGLGGNGTGSSNFTTNTLSISNSTVNSTVSIGGDNNNLSYANGIGGNNSGGQADFTGNNLTLSNSNLNANALVGGGSTAGLNAATSLGGNSFNGIDANFISNAISITGGSLNANAVLGGDNTGSLNRSIGINMNAGSNTVTIDQATFNLLSRIDGNNTGTNTANGLNAAATSTINLSNSTVNVTAQAAGTSTATGTSGAGVFNVTNTLINTTP